MRMTKTLKMPWTPSREGAWAVARSLSSGVSSLTNTTLKRAPGLVEETETGEDPEAALETVAGVVTAVTPVTIAEAEAEVAAVIVTEEAAADHPGPAPDPVLVIGLTPQEIGGEMTAETGEMIAEMADVANVPAAEEAIETAEIAEVVIGAGTPQLGKTGTTTEETETIAAETVTEPTVIETSPANKMATLEERIPSPDLPVRVRSATTT